MANIEIVNAVKKFFQNQDWKYDYFEEEGMFQSAVGLTEDTGVMIHAIIGEGALTVMTALELTVQTEACNEVREFINDVNARMLLGGLVLDCDEGILFFRVGQNCINQVPTAEIIEDAFMYPITFMDENYETFEKLLDGKLTASEALEEMF